MSISRGSACLLWVWHLLVAPGEDEHIAVGVHGHRRTAQQLAALTQGGGGNINVTQNNDSPGSELKHS